ncbi:MAG TPA: AAA family ATPase [Ktedonobacteraceae bacterium]|nr:AAA family ATPase [Ktedonobacteraceae bacterium]
MRVIEFKSKKGGVGKSAAAREIATMMAAAGANVVLIDASEQANDDILENQDRPFDITLKECVIDGIPLRDAARQVRRGLWLIAGTRDHEDVNDHIRKERYPNIFHDMIEELRASLTPTPAFDQRFEWWQQERLSFSVFALEQTNEEEFTTLPPYVDYVLIDTDASTQDDLTFVIWDAIDGIIIPFELTELDWQSYHQLRQDLVKRYKRRPEQQPPILGIIPNKVLHTRDNPTPMTYLKTIFRDVEEQVFRPVHWSKIFGEILNQRLASLEHPLASTDRSVREIGAIALELMGYTGDLTGMKICEKCSEQLTLAMQEQQERAS